MTLAISDVLIHPRRRACGMLPPTCQAMTISPHSDTSRCRWRGQDLRCSHSLTAPRATSPKQAVQDGVALPPSCRPAVSRRVMLASSHGRRRGWGGQAWVQATGGGGGGDDDDEASPMPPMAVCSLRCRPSGVLRACPNRRGPQSRLVRLDLPCFSLCCAPPDEGGQYVDHSISAPWAAVYSGSGISISISISSTTTRAWLARRQASETARGRFWRAARRRGGHGRRELPSAAAGFTCSDISI